MKRRSDPELQSAVEREIELDERLQECGIQVRVDRGIVTLSGQVSGCARRTAAQEAAHRVAGVFDVVNDIQVSEAHGPRRSDAEIARAVRDTLEWDVFVPDQQIHSTVSAGRVTLEGRVALHRERDDVARAVRNLSGVVAVINRIEVVTPPVAADDLRKAIQAALQRQVEREVNGIELDVEQGKVVLRGVVRCWKERDAVLGAVKGTRGVQAIEHTLRVDPEA